MDRQPAEWESRQLPHCPQCEQVELRRHGRVGFLQRSVLPLLGLYPWECGLCRKIYLLRQRSRGYAPAEIEIPAPGPPVSQAKLELIANTKNRNAGESSTDRQQKAAL